jgi:GxxExxY protein
MELIFKEEVYSIMGAAMGVHRELGSGLLESVYQEAVEIELVNREIPFEAQKPIRITYKGQLLKKEFVRSRFDMLRQNRGRTEGTG